MSDLSTLFDYFNLVLSHSLNMSVPSITLNNRIYYKSPWFNIELINLRQLHRRLQCKYTSSNLILILLPLKFVDRF